MDSIIYNINDAMILFNFIPDKIGTFWFLLAIPVHRLPYIIWFICFFSEFGEIRRFQYTTAIQNVYPGLCDGFELFDTSLNSFYICVKSRYSINTESGNLNQA